LGNLSTPIRVQKLQIALHAKAKAEAGYRFYALYDKIYREDVLAHAYAQCRSNKGAPGVDRQDFAEVEAYGVQKWLGELAFALRQETYQPDPVRGVFIPKANGKLRPLGISTLRDRVQHTPIDDTSRERQHQFGVGNTSEVVRQVSVNDIRLPSMQPLLHLDYRLLGISPRAISVLLWRKVRFEDRFEHQHRCCHAHLIKMWLECPVEETDDRGRKIRTTEARDSRCGIPQGSPISPLLANVYMRRFVLAWKKLGLQRSLGSRIVTYADDLVILCKQPAGARRECEVRHANAASRPERRRDIRAHVARRKCMGFRPKGDRKRSRATAPIRAQRTRSRFAVASHRHMPLHINHVRCISKGRARCSAKYARRGHAAEVARILEKSSATCLLVDTR
jgi:RNA-directed DNA polymerase